MSSTGAFPSDLDPSFLFSDFRGNSDIPDHSFEPESGPQPNFSDDIRALVEVAQERVGKLSKAGVVIQHRAYDPTPAFRISPTPTARRTRPLNPIEENFDQLINHTSPPPSSPPMESPIRGLDPEPTPSQMSAVAESPKDTPPAPRRFVPTPLTGGLFSRKFPVGAENFKPTGSAAGQDAQTISMGAGALTDTLTPMKATYALPTPRLTPKTEQSEVTIVTSSGDTIKVCRKPKVPSRTLQKPVAEEPVPTCLSRSYFGVDIHFLLSQCEVDRERAKLGRQNQDCVPSQTQAVDASCKKSLLWTEKYRARRFADLVGDERTHRHVLRWLKTWDPIVFPSGSKPQPKKHGRENQQELERKRILLVHGPPGLGKTTLAHVAAKQAGYEPLEINASDDRSSNIVKGKIKDMLTIECVKSGLKNGKSQSTAARPVCIVVDEIDGVTGGGGGEAGFMKALVDLVMADQRNSDGTGSTADQVKRKRKRKDEFKLNRPIIAVCNDFYAPALKPLRALAEVVHMRAPPNSLIAQRLEWIFEREGIAAEDGAARKIVELSCNGKSRGRKGDMRGALVSAEWISTRLQRGGSSVRGLGSKRVLTKKMVEEELSGTAAGKEDGKRSASATRLGIKDAIDAVFYLGKERVGGQKANGSTPSSKYVQEMVESLGEFDKITMDCFATYPTLDFQDDFRLTKPNMAYEWLWFSDRLSSRVFDDQAYELSSYLSAPVVAFHHLFASPVKKSQDQDKSHEEADEKPFTGPGAEWQAHEATREHEAILQSIHSSLPSTRLAMTFKNLCCITTELVPYVNRMLSPSINPVVVGGSSGMGVASVRRECEKTLVERAISAMEATGVRFEKLRVDLGTGGGASATGWAYRMEPSLDTLSVYPSYAIPEGGSRQPVRYAVRQVLDQEWKKACLMREKAVREARMGSLTGSAAETATLTAPEDKASETRKRQRIGTRTRKDFFGRIIEEPIFTEEEKARKKRKIESVAATDVWVTFHEGFSNAVRKGIRLADLMDSFL